MKTFKPMALSSLTGCILYIQFLKPLLILLFFSYFNSRNFIYILLKSLVTLKVLTIIYIIGVRFEVRLNVNEKKRKFTEKKTEIVLSKSENNWHQVFKDNLSLLELLSSEFMLKEMKKKANIWSVSDKTNSSTSSSGANPTKLFFFGNEELFHFLLLSLAVVRYTHFFHMLQTLKLKSKNRNTRKMKVW